MHSGVIAKLSKATSVCARPVSHTERWGLVHQLARMVSSPHRGLLLHAVGLYAVSDAIGLVCDRVGLLTFPATDVTHPLFLFTSCACLRSVADFWRFLWLRGGLLEIRIRTSATGITLRRRSTAFSSAHSRSCSVSGACTHTRMLLGRSPRTERATFRTIASTAPHSLPAKGTYLPVSPITSYVQCLSCWDRFPDSSFPRLAGALIVSIATQVANSQPASIEGQHIHRCTRLP